MPRENRESSGGWRVPGGPRGQRSGRNGPLQVHIVSGQDEFFQSFRKALGMGEGQAGGAGGVDQFKAMLGSQQALQQANKQVAEELRASTKMIGEFTAVSGKQLAEVSRALKEQTQLMQAGYAGGGAGGGGGGDGGGGFFGDRGIQSGGFRHHATSLGQLRQASRDRVMRRFEQMQQAEIRKREEPIRDRVGALAWEEAVNNPEFTSDDQRQRYMDQQVNQAITSSQKNDPSNWRRASMYGRIAAGVNYGGVAGGLRATPVIGGAMAVGAGISQGAEWLTNQRAKNAVYQNIYGGENTGGAGGLIGGIGDFFGGRSSDATTGFGNRMAEEGFVLGQRFSAGGLTGEAASAAFQGVSSLGYKGAPREEALNFITEQYKQLGMDVNESLQLVNLTAKYTTTNLKSVSKELGGVTKAAQRTGQSAATLRQIFTGNLEAAAAGGAGVSSASLAGAMTNVTAGRGRTLAGVDVTGMFTNVNTRYAAAAFAGTTPGALAAEASRGNLVPTLQASGQLQQSLLGSAIPPALQSQIKKRVQEAGGANASPGALDTIAIDVLKTVDLATIHGVLRSMGITADSDLAASRMIVEMVMGNTFDSEGRKQTKAATAKQIGHGGMSQGTQKQVNRARSEWAVAEDQENPLDWIFGGEAANAAEGKANAWEAYGGLEKRTGFTDPAIQQAIGAFGGLEEFGVRVQTKKGDRVVSLSDAIKYYPGQVSAGSATAESADPNKHGRRLSELGITPTVGGDYKGVGKSQGKHGMTVQDWRDEYDVAEGAGGKPKSADSGSGEVTVSLSPQVAQLFQFSGSGNVSIDQGATSGIPPDLAPNLRPGGS